KLRRTVQERMSLKDISEMTPRSLINPKSISAAIEYFFGRGELSQVVDQTNPLSMLTHERRLSALGPGGLNRKRAGFEVRDVHISHYGRICPIETPEGTNIGLISSLAIYSGVDSYGFLVTPYRKVSKSKLLDDVVWLRADEEHEAYLAPADAPVVDGRVQGETIVARYRGDFVLVPAEKVQYIDVAPSQMVGVSAGLIPFLEHDDANRALMGSNMQRQAVPLLVTEPPIVATGMERDVAANSGLLVRASRKGVITYVDAESIEINETDVYKLRKYVGLNERTCQNQKPIVQLGQKVEKNEVIADGAATFKGELALGRNVLVGFMSWDGFNFEDAIIISEELVEDDVYTSIHIEEYDIEIRDTKLGREEFTRDIPNVGERALHNLDDGGIVRIGTYVRSGDILVGKVSPKSKTELTPEEKLLHAIFGRAGEDVKNDSLEVPSGVEGIVIATEKFARQMSLSEEERRDFQKQIKEAESEGNLVVAEAFGALVAEIEKVLQKPLAGSDGSPLVRNQDHKIVAERAAEFSLDALDIRSPQRKTEIEKLYKTLWPAVEEALDAKERRLNSMKRGDELRPGVLQMVKVYVAAKRVISVGDKMAGRHGNKGVIAKVLPKEDMPFLADGTPVQIMLNPLGVPSRMNVGQILETHLGWAGKMLGFQAVTPVFDGASEEEINAVLDDANLPKHGKSKLYDGRTGEPLEQETTVGYIYMLKLHHLVDDKVHARSTGPYSLITQQPLGGKARFGGQRFGEMEVWALEAYGAAYILQELLTVKSDDVEGRTKIYESMVKGENTLEAGTPASFDVLTNEIRGLALNMQLEKRRI
ncbi:MAG: DNA-directed RNA polymerase subunit beta, partial [Planctomycetaceae bacterium]|nr:DNA-directed RNA polymerase subunit beta [Planctomycetaceae bacterium]